MLGWIPRRLFESKYRLLCLRIYQVVPMLSQFPRRLFELTFRPLSLRTLRLRQRLRSISTEIVRANVFFVRSSDFMTETKAWVDFHGTYLPIIDWREGSSESPQREKVQQEFLGARKRATTCLMAPRSLWQVGLPQTSFGGSDDGRGKPKDSSESRGASETDGGASMESDAR